MAMEIPTPHPQSWAVATYLPNERETQILGGTDVHAEATYSLGQTLRVYSRQEGKHWLVRAETELRYPRADGTTGVFYPDVLVAPDVWIDPEAAYDVRAVGKPPALVVEVLSKKTARKDVGPKLLAYAELGVAEYVTFDPRSRRQRELRGYRLVGRRYLPIPPASEGGLWLRTISLRMEAEAPRSTAEGPLLRLTTREGRRLLLPDEEAAARDTADRVRWAAERALEVERAARAAAERNREAAERDREAEKQARETAEQAYAAAQAELARLRALVDPASGHPDPVE